LEDLSILEQRIGYVFKDRKLLQRAVTHRSFAAEHNERLEFLGDSVLNCVIGYALFLRDTHFTEGVLSRVRANLVCEKTLAVIARRIDVSSFLRMGEGEMKTGGAHRPSIMADAMEAIFGAVFKESGFEAAQKVILGLFEPILTSLTPEQLSKDAKTRLQECLQGHHLPLPHYEIVNVEGAAHAQHFTCECHIQLLDIVTTGHATSRREAEQEAAAAALEILKKREVKP
jgi:ribonuclease III